MSRHLPLFCGERHVLKNLSPLSYMRILRDQIHIISINIDSLLLPPWTVSLLYCLHPFPPQGESNTRSRFCRLRGMYSLVAASMNIRNHKNRWNRMPEGRLPASTVAVADFQEHLTVRPRHQNLVQAVQDGIVMFSTSAVFLIQSPQAYASLRLLAPISPVYSQYTPRNPVC